MSPTSGQVYLASYAHSLHIRNRAACSFLPLSRPSVLSYAMFCPPLDYACALAAAVATLLMTAGQPQELQRTLPGARRISFADESGLKLWARYQ